MPAQVDAPPLEEQQPVAKSRSRAIPLIAAGVWLGVVPLLTCVAYALLPLGPVSQWNPVKILVDSVLMFVLSFWFFGSVLPLSHAPRPSLAKRAARLLALAALSAIVSFWLTYLGFMLFIALQAIFGQADYPLM